ncbi:MAG TPA: chitinase [Patescibacteria group bacterium]|nr:chitinase [Patescibacteria group bacterium]
MSKIDATSTTVNTEKRRRLSPWRVILALLMLAGISWSIFWSLQRFKDNYLSVNVKPWFAEYVDVTATPIFDFEHIDGKSLSNNAVLSFIVSSAKDTCTPAWGGAYTLDEAGVQLDLDRRIALFRQKQGNIAVSFGGLRNDELAVKCEDQGNLIEAYKSVIDRYGIDTIDLDLEGNGLTDPDALKRRGMVVAELQKTKRLEGKSLAVWLTLPVSPQGLTQDGTNAVSAMLSEGVDLAGVNVMTMDYGASREKNQTMQQASEMALTETHRQLRILYNQSGKNLSDSTLWTKIGATPMIGQNDFADEIFTLEDAAGLNEFAISKGIARISIWSGNRDVECGENYVNISVVSDSCSGIKQEKSAFTNILGRGFAGDISGNASLITVESPATKQKPDNPDESPYQIWSESGTYLQGTKVVWHQSVYQAKWWTQGNLPDNPVLQSWETPWQLIGPVLPGEKPIPQVTLPAGIYPVWSGETVYDDGQRVLFNGIPYQAKWWTQGDSPAASTSNPDSSPWMILTKEEIDKVIVELGGN